MVVVIGDLTLGTHGRGVAPLAVAAAVASAGRVAQAVGIVPVGAAGDSLLLELAKAGVRHAAVLRSDKDDMEPEDLELALRYLPDTRVIVAVGLRDPLVATAARGAAWSTARLIVIDPPTDELVSEDSRSPARASLADDAIVLEAPATDPDGTFAGFAGDLAARLDGGEEPRRAWDAAMRAKAVDAISPRGR